MTNRRLNIFRFQLILILFIFRIPGQAQENSEIRNIIFKGNEAFKDSRLLDVISFSRSSGIRKTLFGVHPTYFSQEAYKMNRDQLTSFYQSEGYLHVSINELSQVRKHPRKLKVDLTFTIVENQPVTIDTLSFSTEEPGDSLLSTRAWQKLLKQLESQPAGRFRDEAVRNDQNRLTTWFSSRGYAYAAAVPEVSLTPDTLQAIINWQIQKGPFSQFGPITIKGEERTPTKAIQKQFDFKEGDTYSAKALSQTQKQIYELGLFRIASVRAQLSTEKAKIIPVEVTIQEAPRISTRWGVGYGREDQFRTSFDLDYLNFPGKTQRAKFYAKHSGLEPYRFEATVTQPAIFSPRSSLALSTYLKRRSEPGFESVIGGAGLSILQNFTDFLSMSTTLDYELVDLDITSEADETLQEYSRSAYSKNGLSIGGLFNTVTPRFDPVKGWSLAVNTRINSPWFGSAYPFVKYLFEVKRFLPVGDGFILASRIKMGSIQPISHSSVSPFEERFFAGGSQSVRGWPRQMLGPLDDEGIPIGGNSLLEGSIEPRVKIVSPLSMVVFLDFGNVWESANHFPLDEIRLAAGTGIRISTPIGPVGIDFARPVFDADTKWQIHLNIGHAF